MRWHGREKEFAEFRGKGRFVDIECLSFEDKKHNGMKILAAALQMRRCGMAGRFESSSNCRWQGRKDRCQGVSNLLILNT